MTATRKIINTIVKCQQCGLIFNNNAKQQLKIQAKDRSTLPKKPSIVDVYKNLKSPLHDYLKNTVIYMSPPGVNVTAPVVHLVNQLAPRVVTNSLLLPQKHQEYTQDGTIISIEVQCCYSFMLSLAQEMAQLLQDGARLFD